MFLYLKDYFSCIIFGGISVFHYLCAKINDYGTQPYSETARM